VRASEQDRPDVAERREAWRRGQKSLGGRLISLDETWTTTAMTRRCAWADVSARATGQAPNGHWKTTMFLAGLTCEGLIAPFVLYGPINAECFLAYVEQILFRVLRASDTVIFDNLSSRAPRTAPLRLLIGLRHGLGLPVASTPCQCFGPDEYSA
jgi:DDE superfamily endonuclease